MDQASQEKQGDKEDKVGSSNQGNPNQDALAASNQDCQSPAGVCPYKGLEIALVPVRYALDEPFKAPEKQPHPLPNSHFKGPLKLTGNAYTLRQLRDGWLYVYDESAQQLDEYEVKGDLFISETKGSHGYLLYPMKHTVLLVFSHQRWTERLKKIYSEDEAVAGDAEVSAI
ncbi:MAG: toxin VasX, partial [Plesiomonas shigelloides]